MFRQLWKTVRAALLVVGILLCFFAFVEMVRAYEVLRDFHPVLGSLFLLLLLAGLVWLVVRYFTEVGRRPSILVVPVRIDPLQASVLEWITYDRYLVRVMKRLSLNDRLSDDLRLSLAKGMEDLKGVIKARGGRESLSAAAKRAENEVIQPAIDVLDQLAEKELRRCVRDVMLGVTLSPWRSVDLLVVLYRNMGMVFQVVSIYNARPRFREQMLVLRDVFTIVATVNYLNYGSKLSENLLATVPGLGRFTDDVAQGAGAGLMTSVAGHSAIERCRDFRGWDRAEAQRTIAGTLTDFMGDIKGIMVDQVVPHLSLEFLDKIKQGIATAIDETARATDLIIRKPVRAAGRGVAQTGAAVTSALLRGGDFLWSAAVSEGKKACRLAGQASVAGGRQAMKGMAAGKRLFGAGMQAVSGKLRSGKKEGLQKKSDKDTGTEGES